ncbi:MAG: FAD binding domain-containing protein [Bacteroidota bacterium]
MIRLPEFELLSPTTWDGLMRTLTLTNGNTKILAGGTDLIVNLKQGTSTLSRVIWLGKLNELRRVFMASDGSMHIGAMCTLSEIATSTIVQKRCRVLVDAVLSIAGPAVRNRATIGGNLCLDTRCYYYNQSGFWRDAVGGCLKQHSEDNSSAICHIAPRWARCSAVFCSDTAPILIALEASVKLVSSDGERTILLRDLYRDDGVHHIALKADEILAEVILPPPRKNRVGVHHKIRARQSIDFPLANVGVSLAQDASRICSDVRIVVGAIQSAPIEAHSAEKVLRGNKLTSEHIELAANEAASSLTPLPHIGDTAGYRKKMITVLIRNALNEIVRKEASYA